MRPNDGSRPVMRMAKERVDQFRDSFRAASPPVRATIVAVGIILSPVILVVGLCLAVLIGLGYAPVAVWRATPSVAGSLSVALWGLVFIEAVVGKSTARLWELDP